MNGRLERAIMLATAAHLGQVDKLGQPYILHPLYVMQNLESESDRIVGVLHDVKEDCPGWWDTLVSSGLLTPDEIATLELLTRPEGEPYMDYIRRVAPHAQARRVKIWDISHNYGRIKSIPDEATRTRLRQKYSAVFDFLVAWEG